MMTKRFLLVDDDPDDRDLFCEAIEDIDPEMICYSAPTGRSALSKLTSKEIDTPDVIFLDVNMPIMNGWQCLSVLKEAEEFKHIPVIMYSTSSHSEDIAKAQNAGAICFFTKPGRFTELVENLRLIVIHITNGSLSSLSTNCSPFVTVLTDLREDKRT